MHNIMEFLCVTENDMFALSHLLCQCAVSIACFAHVKQKVEFAMARLTLQEMCCGFLLSREMWYRKSVLPGTGAG